MIAKMTKYSILLLGSDKDAILSQIRDLGLLDITRSAKPIDKHSEALLQEIRDARSAADAIARIDFTYDPDAEAIAKEAEGVPDFEGDFRREADERLARLHTLEGKLEETLREAKALAPWGRFNADSIARLAEKGVALHFYTAPAKRFSDDWASQWPLEVIHRDEGTVWFVAETLGRRSRRNPRHGSSRACLRLYGGRQQGGGPARRNPLGESLAAGPAPQPARCAKARG